MRLMVIHSLPKGITKDEIIEMGKRVTTDARIKGYRSFLSLSEGLGCCVFDAPDKETLANFLKSQKLSYDSISAVELEGSEGNIREVQTPVSVTASDTDDYLEDYE